MQIGCVESISRYQGCWELKVEEEEETLSDLQNWECRANFVLRRHEFDKYCWLEAYASCPACRRVFSKNDRQVLSHLRAVWLRRYE